MKAKASTLPRLESQLKKELTAMGKVRDRIDALLAEVEEISCDCEEGQGELEEAIYCVQRARDALSKYI